MVVLLLLIEHLKINYQVQELDDDGNPTGDVIAERYVEVIPDVALQCP